MEMGKAQWDKISKEIVDALSNIATKHDITFESHGFTYSSEKCTFKTLATVNDASGQKRDLEREEFTRYFSKSFTQHYGVKLDWLDKSFIERGRSYTLVGLKSGRTRYCMITRRDDGEVYCWPIDFVKNKFTSVDTAAA
jgi:hypothetical protein